MRVASIIRKRFPPWADCLSVFAACALPVFAWAIVAYLNAFPGYVLRLSIWDIIGTASYVLALALFESLVITLPFVLVAALLPPRLFKNHFVAISAIVVGITSLWVMYVNYYRIDLAGWDSIQWLETLILYFVTVAIPLALALVYARAQVLIQRIMERVSVLIYVYVALAGIGVLVVLIRNL